MRSTSIKLCPEIMSRLAFLLVHQSHNIRNQSFPLLMGSLAMVLHKDNSRLWRNVIPHQVLVGLHGGVIQGLCGDMQFRCLVIHETSDSMRLRCRRARLRWSLVPKPCGNPCYFPSSSVFGVGALKGNVVSYRNRAAARDHDITPLVKPPRLCCRFARLQS